MSKTFCNATRTCNSLWSRLVAGPVLSRARMSRRAAACRTPSFIERLEARALMSAATDPIVAAALTPTTTTSSSSTTAVTVDPSVVAPSVTSTNPAQGATGVLRDAYIACEVHIPNGGIDSATLSYASVYLYKSGTGQRVPSFVNTSGAGDVIVLRPQAVLDPNTKYTFIVSSALKDVSGVAFTPLVRNFTTGAGTSSTDPSVQFTKTTLPTTAGRRYMSLAIGPDDKLYAGTDSGDILRFTIGADGSVSDAQVIDTLLQSNGSPRFVEGMTFDPASTKDNLILWVSNTAAGVNHVADWTGKITRLSGANLETAQDAVVHLPRSARDHVTGQPSFGPDGALYFCQPSNTAMGEPDAGWDNRPEHLLTAAILRLDVRALGDNTVDALTPDGGGTYDPHAAGAPLTLYATGVRNSYDLVWDSNGSLYAPTNGSAAGGNVPAGPDSPELTNVSQPETDFLFKIQQGAYYGHPNPERHQYVLNGGNPTSGTDPYEMTDYPVGTRPDSNWHPADFDLGVHESPDGAIEYVGNAFGGALDHKLLITRYSGGKDLVALGLDSNGNVNKELTGMTGMTGLDDPIDVIEHLSTGDLYVSELGTGDIVLLRPVGGGGIQTSGGVDASTGSGSTPTPTPAPVPQTRREQRLASRIQRFGASHDMSVGDVASLKYQALQNELAAMKSEARRSAAVQNITKTAAKKNYPLPNLSTYSIPQLRDLRQSIRAARRAAAQP